jgi:hypothetical protein
VVEAAREVVREELLSGAERVKEQPEEVAASGALTEDDDDGGTPVARLR